MWVYYILERLKENNWSCVPYIILIIFLLNIQALCIVYKDSGRLGYDALSVGTWSPTFRWTVAPLYSKLRDPRRILLDPHTLRSEGATVLRNVGNHTPDDRESYPRRPESSASPL
jgi:hypothetical protein